MMSSNNEPMEEKLRKFSIVNWLLILAVICTPPLTNAAINMLGATDYFGSISFSAHVYYFLDGSGVESELTMPLFDHNFILSDNI